jgi:NAD(P)-dependent dehydrogenase (short-subunit alcohol dehydrogenase family)
MKIIIVGAHGTLGKEVCAALQGPEHTLIKAGRKAGDARVDITNRASIRAMLHDAGRIDAIVNCAGTVAFAPLQEISEEQWQLTLNSKLMGQVQLAQEAIAHLNDGGSITLVSGILAEKPIRAGVAASLANRAIEGFVMAAATELPRGLRINVVSPTIVEESKQAYGHFFPGFIPVPAQKVGQAYKRCVMGVESGQILRVGEF